MRVLVTVGARFIGSHVADALLAGGHEVMVPDASPPQAHRGAQPARCAGYELVTSDVADPPVLLDELPASAADPAAIAERRESVALAFVAALQLLPATQRAVLILREVLAWPARDVADLLDTTVAGVNSALQRARATLGAASTADLGPRHLNAHEQQVLDRFLRAWHACDIPALAALLRDDVTLTMPPQAILITGRDQVAGFFATVPANGRLDLIRLVVTRANGHPTLAAYLPGDHTWECRGYGILVLTITDDQVATIVGFPDPNLFPIFNLPDTA